MSTVRIIYKSGAEITIKCDKFATTTNVYGELTKVEWENAKPRPLHTGVSDIAAIWVVKG